MPFNATVTELIIPKDKLEDIQKILDSKSMVCKKKERIIAATGFKAFCCVCNGITSPSYQVRYSDPEVVKLEIYCSTHIESVYQKTKDSTSEELAARYNCQIGDFSRKRPNPWD